VGVESVAAGLIAGEGGLLHHKHVSAGLSQKEGRGSPGWASTDNDDLSLCYGGHMCTPAGMDYRRSESGRWLRLSRRRRAHDDRNDYSMVCSFVEIAEREFYRGIQKNNVPAQVVKKTCVIELTFYCKPFFSCYNDNSGLFQASCSVCRDCVLIISCYYS
jgi:hypothetical protein